MSDSVPTIGLIGLGLMGAGFAKRLRRLNYPVVGFDVLGEKVADAAGLGVAAAASPADVAQRADLVLVSVTTTAAVAAVVGGPEGILSVAKPRARVLVDHSTTEIDTTRSLAAQLDARGAMTLVDAPVSGGPAAAEEGSLAIMAGGRDDAILAIRPVMEKLGRFTHMGAVGAGQATKLVNQTLVLTNYCVMAEALRLAEAYGVDAARIPHALATGHAGSNLLPLLFERMIARDFAPRGYARQVLKDLEMLNAAAQSQHLAMPMASQALTFFRMLVAQGGSELDATAVLNLLPEVAPERHR
jgi:3-hydroxyisobutyrate dehydrogenase-like beta-hydroxyacid dehydrogenase